VGVLVQANYGDRHLLRIDGVPVGRAIGVDAVPLPGPGRPPEAGAIVVVVATDAPLLPTQCRRLAQRATIGLAQVGGIGANGSGDLFLAFATGNRGLHGPVSPDGTLTLRMLPNRALTALFEAVAEATEEAIVNALCAATTTTGIDGTVAHALPLEPLCAVLRHHHRLDGAPGPESDTLGAHGVRG
jgi:D-aminopeptidase